MHPTELFMTPEQAMQHLHLNEPDDRLKLGVTVFNTTNCESTIIINSQLLPGVQQAVLAQERVQSSMYTKYLKDHPERHIEDIMPYAHYAGLDAGVALAKKLGVLDDYLSARGLGETEESIRLALRP